jgi:Gas vesicle synthesis protein GvpL/GvpF
VRLYLYAVVESTASLPGTTGIGGHGVALLAVDRVAAIVGAVDGPVEASRDHLLAHARIVDEVAAANDALLPVRFGRGFHDANELAAALAGISTQLEARLHAVEGCVELGVLASEAATAQPNVAGGREYMRRPELTLACTGPWPPYSFAGLQDGPS